MTKAQLLAFVKKNPLSIGSAALSLALAGGIYFRGGDVPAAEEELAQKSTEGARYAANLQNAAQLKEQADALAAANKEIEARLFHVAQNLTNYQYFYKLESETGTKVTVNQGLPPKGAGKGAFISIPFTVSVQGNLGQVLDFLHRLESGAHYCRVLNVTCSVPPTDRNTPLTLALNLELLGLP